MSISAQSAIEGYISGTATGAPAPAALYVAYAAGNKLTHVNATLPLSSDGRLSLYSRHVAQTTGNVTGYYAPQIRVSAYGNGTVRDKTNRILSLTRTAVGSYRLFVDRDVKHCAGVASTQVSGYVPAVYLNSSEVEIFIRDLGSSNGELTDTAFRLVIAC